MTALSWQPPLVTKCGECQHKDYATCGIPVRIEDGYDIYSQNKNGITQTCPMWWQQNKDEKCTAQT